MYIEGSNVRFYETYKMKKEVLLFSPVFALQMLQGLSSLRQKISHKC